jgi:hypothetical protein
VPPTDQQVRIATTLSQAIFFALPLWLAAAQYIISYFDRKDLRVDQVGLGVCYIGMSYCCILAIVFGITQTLRPVVGPSLERVLDGLIIFAISIGLIVLFLLNTRIDPKNQPPELVMQLIVTATAGLLWVIFIAIAMNPTPYGEYGNEIGGIFGLIYLIKNCVPLIRIHFWNGYTNESEGDQL